VELLGCVAEHSVALFGLLLWTGAAERLHWRELLCTAVCASHL